MKLNINDRTALAIKNNTKRVEIRANKENSEHDYGKLRQNDIIEFTSNNLGVFYVKVKEINHYNSLEELFTLEVQDIQLHLLMIKKKQLEILVNLMDIKMLLRKMVYTLFI